MSTTVQRLSSVSYDVIFMDDHMPNMTGVETTSHLRELGVTVPIFGVTGNALLSDQARFVAAGVTKVVTKPISKASIIAAVQIARAAQAAERSERSDKNEADAITCSSVPTTVVVLDGFAQTNCWLGAVNRTRFQAAACWPVFLVFSSCIRVRTQIRHAC